MSGRARWAWILSVIPRRRAGGHPAARRCVVRTRRERALSGALVSAAVSRGDLRQQLSGDLLGAGGHGPQCCGPDQVREAADHAGGALVEEVGVSGQYVGGVPVEP